ncbi:MAG: hypothetical protein U0559_09300 [Anaerolineae bacterium]
MRKIKNDAVIACSDAGPLSADLIDRLRAAPLVRMPIINWSQ